MALSRRTMLLALGAAGLAACSPAADEPASDPAPPSDAPEEAEQANPLSYLGEFNALGTEPFWALDIRPDQLHLQRPDAEPVVWNNPGPTVVGNVATWQIDDLILTLTEEPCSDGMSDRTYPWSAQVTVADVELKGCAMRPERALAAL